MGTGQLVDVSVAVIDWGEVAVRVGGEGLSSDAVAMTIPRRTDSGAEIQNRIQIIGGRSVGSKSFFVIKLAIFFASIEPNSVATKEDE